MRVVTVVSTPPIDKISLFSDSLTTNPKAEALGISSSNSKVQRAAYAAKMVFRGVQSSSIIKCDVEQFERSSVEVHVATADIRSSSHRPTGIGYGWSTVRAIFLMRAFCEGLSASTSIALMTARRSAFRVADVPRTTLQFQHLALLAAACA